MIVRNQAQILFLHLAPFMPQTITKGTSDRHSPVFCVGDRYGSEVFKRILFDQSMARLPEQVRSYEGMVV